MSAMYITEPSTSGKVTLDTTIGDIDIELWCKECPLACRNFIQLCMEGYYDGCQFHRLVKDFIVQTGDPTATGHGGQSVYGENFKVEPHQRLKFNRRGLLGTAGQATEGNDSQFFITLAPAESLNGKHTLFGKVVGDTVFNVIELNKYEVDKNERPIKMERIKRTKVLTNPFTDIHVRTEKKAEKSRKREKGASGKSTADEGRKRNTGLLSFGEEMDEEQTLSKKFKAISAHDMLEDKSLSRESAVKPEELGTGTRETDAEEIGRIKEKFSSRASRGRNAVRSNAGQAERNTEEHEEDLERAIDEQRKAEKSAELAQISQELKALQKEYKKALRSTEGGEDEREEEVKETNAMKGYKSMKLKFKADTKGIVKSVDPKREEQTMGLLERFQTKLSRATVQGILHDKRVDMSDQRTQREIIDSSTSASSPPPQGQMDLDAEDLPGDEWMAHTLIAPEDTSGVTKAHDASMKEFDEEWYPIDDPRNKMNVRKRAGLEADSQKDS